MIVRTSIEDLLSQHVLVNTTDPWPAQVQAQDPDDLTYTALVRCACGAGMAHHKERAVAWGCSAILTGQAEPGPDHSELYPFYMWKFKAEHDGETTR